MRFPDIFLIVMITVLLFFSVGITFAQQSHQWDEIFLPSSGSWIGLRAEFLDSNSSSDFTSKDWLENSGKIYYNGKVGIGTGSDVLETSLNVKTDSLNDGIAIYNLSSFFPNILLSAYSLSYSLTAKFDQNLGIGPSKYNPGEKVDVEGNTLSAGYCIGSQCRNYWIWSNNTGGKIYYVYVGNVGIGTSGNPKGLLEINSTTSGLIIPRMTPGEKALINGGNPPVATVIVNTGTDNIEYYNGTWNSLKKS